jgi:hypothetical protein
MWFFDIGAGYAKPVSPGSNQIYWRSVTLTKQQDLPR